MNTIQQSRAASCPIVRKPTTTPGRCDRVARLALHLGLTSAVLTTWLHVKPRTRGLASNLLGYALKIVSGATAPILVATGLASALLTDRRRFLRSLPGWIGTLLGLRFIWQVCSHADPTALPDQTRSPDSSKCTGALKSAELSPHAHRGARMTRNLTFATVPGSDQRSPSRLLCDLWEPAPGVARTGLGIIYLHGGAWQSFDKDVHDTPLLPPSGSSGTRRDGRRLPDGTRNGHTACWAMSSVLSLGSRDISATLGVDPNRVVLAGGSAGGHLALMAGYTPNSPKFDPATRTIAIRRFAPSSPSTRSPTSVRSPITGRSRRCIPGNSLGQSLGLFPRQRATSLDAASRRPVRRPTGSRVRCSAHLFACRARRPPLPAHAHPPGTA